MSKSETIQLPEPDYTREDFESFMDSLGSLRKYIATLETDLFLDRYNPENVTKVLKGLAYDMHEIEHVMIDHHRVDVQGNLQNTYSIYEEAPTVIKNDPEDTYRLLAFIRKAVPYMDASYNLWLSDVCVNYEELRMTVLESIAFDNGHIVYNKKGTDIQAVATDMVDEAHVEFTELFSVDGGEQKKHKVHWSLLLKGVWATPSIKFNYVFFE